MNMQTAVITCFKKFITIKGRASRSELWWFYLFMIITGKLLSFFIDIPIFRFDFPPMNAPFLGILTIITFIPLICVIIRRFHDVNISAWWILFYCLYIAFINIVFPLLPDATMEEPILLFSIIKFIIFIILIAIVFGSPIVALVILCIKGTAGDNRFGADPLAEENPH